MHFEVSRKADGNYEVTGIHIMSAPAEQATSEVSSATVNGVVNAVNLDLRTLNISREAIDKWQRPAATMDFFVADHIELSDVQVGDAIRFTFEVQDELIIVDLMSANEPIGNGHQDHSGH